MCLYRRFLSSSLYPPVYFCKLKNISKGKVIHVHVMEVYGRGGGMAPLILNLGSRWR